MPTYAYKCQQCQHELEIFQKIVDAPLTHCPQCKNETLRRGPGGGIGTLFTGSGWYKDNYATPKDEKSTPKEEKPKESLPKGDCCPCGKTSSEGSCKP